MIKIIKCGKKRQKKCSHCESILEFEKEDIKRKYIGLCNYYEYITCPVCNSIVIV